MSAREIVLPVTEPETEWVRGRALQKMSPTYAHARIQLLFGAELDAWAGDRGDVGTEWRFRVPVPDGPLQPLVPDISFVARDRLAPFSDQQLAAPPISPDIAVEIFSPGDDPRDVADKIETFLRAGTMLVIVIDPALRSFALHDARDGTTIDAHGIVMHPALPGFALATGPFFTRALDRRR